MNNNDVSKEKQKHSSHAPVCGKSKSCQIFILKGPEKNLLNIEGCNKEISHSIDVCIQYLSYQFIGISKISLTEILICLLKQKPCWFYYYY